MLLALSAAQSPAAIIDDFSTPQGPLSAVQDAVSGPGIVGNSREVTAGNLFEVTGGIATFSSPTSLDNVMSIVYDGTITLGDNATFAPVDLTDAGNANRFLLGVSGFEGPFGASVALGVTDANLTTIVAATFPINAAGLYSTLIPANGIDFTQINRVYLALFLGTQVPNRSSLSIDFVCTGTLEAGCTAADPVTAAPEPGTAGLLALGAAALGLFRRRKATAHRSVDQLQALSKRKRSSA